MVFVNPVWKSISWKEFGYEFDRVMSKPRLSTAEAGLKMASVPASWSLKKK